MSSESYTKNFPISWDQLHRDSKALAWRLLDKGPFNSLIIITRGGMVPSAIVARELDIKLIDTVCVSSYDWQDQGQTRILKPIEGYGEGEGVLLIDDLVDTGRTAKVVRAMLPKAHFASIYAKPEGRPLVDTYVTEVSQDTWILFPWDSEVQYTKPLSQLRGE